MPMFLNKELNTIIYNKETQVRSLLFTALMALASTAVAVPALQVYSDGASYDIADESWAISGPSFTLQALATNQSNTTGFTNVTQAYLSLATMGDVAADAAISIFHTESGTTATYSFADLIFGTPPDASGDLASHGIYDTYFAEFGFLLGDSCLACVSDMVDGSAAKNGWVNNFEISFSGFDMLHIDLYTLNSSGGISLFAPFSHDAYATSVPEPTPLILLGIGLLAFGIIKRRKS